jgi:dienelactone hydrolase
MAGVIGVPIFILTFLCAVGAPLAETIRFAVPGTDNKTFTGTLDLPAGARAPVPVVVMLPGSEGVDQRQDFHRQALLPAGIGTFVIDIKSGNFTSRRNRPRASYFFPVGYEALRVLRARGDIDGAHIAVMGWSFGATISVGLSHSGAAPDWLNGKPGFAAHVGLYGGCTSRSSVVLEKVPVLVLIGSEDTYTDPARCARFESLFSNVTVVTYAGAHHGFDKEGVDHERGDRIMRWNEDAALDARKRVVAFLTRVLRLGAAR